MSLIKKLQDEIGMLKEQISLMQCSTISCPNNQELHRSTKPVPQATNNQPKFDRKFNIIVYGIQESSPGTSRLTRAKETLEKVVDILSAVSSHTFSADYIRDCHQLGKFRENF